MESDKVTRAICVLSNPEKGVKGLVTFEETGNKTKIVATFSGLEPGLHGFHIHEFGNLTNYCQTAGAHYNPYKKTHGSPKDENRHVGDLGNVEADSEGNAKLELEDELIRLTGEHSIIGRSVVVHADEDDLGKGGKEDSLTTGHAGARVACGIIGVTEKF
jgi:Cu-Zn family superoxide dismutase